DEAPRPGGSPLRPENPRGPTLPRGQEGRPGAPGLFAVSHWARRFAVSPRMIADRTAPNLPSLKQQTALLGPSGFEHVATAGPRRPVAVRFSPRGDALYVADFGAMTVVPSALGPMPRPFPGTGVIW